MPEELSSIIKSSGLGGSLRPGIWLTFLAGVAMGSDSTSRAGGTGLGIISERRAGRNRQALLLHLPRAGAVCGADLGSAGRGANAKVATPPRTLFGTLDMSISIVGTEKRAGLSVAMFELDWASIEPHKGDFSDSYITSLSHTLWRFRAEGMRVTLGLGLEDPPSWVYSLPDSSYVNQFGQVSREADMVFSEPVRQAAESYLKHVFAALPLRDVWAIRLTSGGDDEMLYPPGGTFWALRTPP